MSYHSYIDNMIETDLENRQSNLKTFWSYLKSLKSLDKVNILNRQYQSVFTQEEPGEAQGVSVFRIRNTETPTAPQPKEIGRLDNISACFLKECVIELVPILAVIFNKSLSQGIVLEDWPHAHITPIYKKNARQYPANYRPVSLTSMILCCNLLEHCIVSHTS